MAINIQNLYQQYLDSTGNVLNGGTLTFYEAGTVTSKDVYTTQAGDTAQSNPYTLDAYGRTAGDVWLAEDGLYDILVKDSSGATVRTDEDVGTDTASANSITETVNRVYNGACQIQDAIAASIDSTYRRGEVRGFKCKASGSTTGSIAGAKVTVFDTAGRALAVTNFTTASGAEKLYARQTMLRNQVYDIYKVSQDSTFSVRIYQDTGTTIPYRIKIYSADAEDDFSAVTLRGTGSDVNVAHATDTQVTYTVDLSTITDANNGIAFEVEADVGDSHPVTTKNFYWTHWSYNIGSSAAAFPYEEYVQNYEQLVNKFSNIEKIHVARFAANATTVEAPSGWSCAKNGTGDYTVTHTMGNSTNWAVFGTSDGGGAYVFHTNTKASTTFDYFFTNTSAAPVDSAADIFIVEYLA